ncbi:TPA: thioether cross-link-forming SCIFF peptide maturase [Clostridioides difficile]|uniref:Anaerobic sulfatase-maturating enzyme homolog YdeM n=11 Tax=Clostridioides difficile TaxID=1496 RepID=A0A069AGH3_CLODI|nr:thioether cross-link-forming SCIFF peptide maturase [Clostridioides difficile]MDC0804923.1 thioether cross-link-forming SCIFF peptide maturase [Clostridium paraputrificum]OFU02857.1 SCIFF radical SAM maturase [Clostridium sp. HMSC19D07]OFU04457.1 SCIFF radical SAM maturase [Clostridium sp. HMSC19E03]OFU16037.1 SCIFF radical SAM maturase [Clostridium sp. HMSC19C09]OFU20863.1 SCIFF radical SAM maturase [Clostridium sp. HMSC19C08]OFU25618.1 SCIFF radical SAM maturase [Clostridium sp. HMSC19C0
MSMIHKFSMNGYNIVLDVNGGAVHVLDDVAYDLLDFYKEKSKEEILEILKSKYQEEKINEAYEEILNLEKEGLLYTEDTYQYHPSFVHREPVVKALCLNVAHDCNLKCKYCFAAQGDFGGEKELMSFEVGKAAIDYLIANSGSRKNLEIDFFGGEPLMNFEVVKQLVDYGRSVEKDYNKNIRFTITTNGVLLNDEIIDYINENMHNVVLSLDGRKEVNDNMRPTLNDKGSYDITLPRFKKLVEKRAKDKYYYIRGTFTRDNLDFSKDVMHFADLGFKLTSVEPVVGDESNPYALREEDLPKIFEEYEKFAVEYADRQLQGDGFKFFHFMIDLNQGPCVIKRITGCGAGNEYLSVTPNGDIYPCHQFVGNEEFKMANIFDEEIVLPENLKNMFREAHVYTKEECKQCWNKFYCSGGCHANAINFNNDISKPYELGCEMQRKRTECSIMIQAKLMLEGATN